LIVTGPEPELEPPLEPPELLELELLLEPQAATPIDAAANEAARLMRLILNLISLIDVQPSLRGSGTVGVIQL
jgi:hypothetical protein